MQELAPTLVLQTLPLEKAAYNIKNGHQSQNVKERHVHFIETVYNEGFISAMNKEMPLSVGKDWKQLVKQLIKKGKYEGSKETRT